MSMSANVHIKAAADPAEAKLLPGAHPMQKDLVVLTIKPGTSYDHVTLMYPDGTPFELVQAVAAAHNAALAATRPAPAPADAEWEAAAPVADAIVAGDAAKLDAFVAATEGHAKPGEPDVRTWDSPPPPMMANLDPRAAGRPDGWTMSRVIRGQNPGSFHFWTFVNAEGREAKVTHPSEEGAWIELAKAIKEGQV